MDIPLRLAHRLCRLMVWLGGIVVLAAAFLIGVEVLIRRFADTTIGGIDEVSGYALAVSSSWTFAFALLHKAHVRIDTFYLLLPRGVRPFLDIAALAILGAFAALVTWHGADVFVLSYGFSARAMTPLATPLWIPQGLWVFGWGMFLIVIFLLLLKTVIAVLRGRFDEALRTAGPMTAADELEEELGDIRRRGQAEGS